MQAPENADAWAGRKNNDGVLKNWAGRLYPPHRQVHTDKFTWLSSPLNPDGQRTMKSKGNSYTFVDHEVNDMLAHSIHVTENRVNPIKALFEGMNLKSRSERYIEEYGVQILDPIMNELDAAETQRVLDERPGRENGVGGQMHSTVDMGHCSTQRTPGGANHSAFVAIDAETSLVATNEVISDGKAIHREPVGAQNFQDLLDEQKIDHVSSTTDNCSGEVNSIFAAEPRKFAEAASDQEKLTAVIGDIWHYANRTTTNMPKHVAEFEPAFLSVVTKIDIYARQHGKTLTQELLFHLFALIEAALDEPFFTKNKDMEAAAKTLQEGGEVDWAAVRDDSVAMAQALKMPADPNRTTPAGALAAEAGSVAGSTVQHAGEPWLTAAIPIAKSLLQLVG